VSVERRGKAVKREYVKRARVAGVPTELRFISFIRFVEPKPLRGGTDLTIGRQDPL
jgi:hypothetical protein